MQELRGDAYTTGWLHCSQGTGGSNLYSMKEREVNGFFWIPAESSSWNRLLHKLNFPERLRGCAVTEMIAPCVFPCLEMQPTKLSLGSGCIYILIPVSVNFPILKLHLCVCIQC